MGRLRHPNVVQIYDAVEDPQAPYLVMESVNGPTLRHFCRADRQLVFRQGMVQEVRLAGVQRRPLLEAAPTADGSLLFCRVPTFGPGEPDWDLAVAARAGEGWSEAVRLDQWRPAP